MAMVASRIDLDGSTISRKPGYRQKSQIRAPRRFEVA